MGLWDKPKHLVQSVSTHVSSWFLGLMHALAHGVSFVDTARTFRAGAIALDDGHWRVRGQRAVQFRWGHVVVDLLGQDSDLLIHSWIASSLVEMFGSFFPTSRVRCSGSGSCIAFTSTLVNATSLASRCPSKSWSGSSRSASMTPRVLGSKALPAAVGQRRAKCRGVGIELSQQPGAVSVRQHWTSRRAAGRR